MPNKTDNDHSYTKMENKTKITQVLRFSLNSSSINRRAAQPVQSDRSTGWEAILFFHNSVAFQIEVCIRFSRSFDFFLFQNEPTNCSILFFVGWFLCRPPSVRAIRWVSSQKEAQIHNKCTTLEMGENLFERSSVRERAAERRWKKTHARTDRRWRMV